MKKLSNVVILLLLCLSLQSCSLFSALKPLTGSGTDKSVDVEANVAARDNKKAIVSREQSESYKNTGNITKTHHGINFKEDSLSKLVWLGGLDVIIVLIIVMVSKVLRSYFKMRAKIITKKLELKMLAMKKKADDKEKADDSEQ